MRKNRHGAEKALHRMVKSLTVLAAERLQSEYKGLVVGIIEEPDGSWKPDAGRFQPDIVVTFKSRYRMDPPKQVYVEVQGDSKAKGHLEKLDYYRQNRISFVEILLEDIPKFTTDEFLADGLVLDDQVYYDPEKVYEYAMVRLVDMLPKWVKAPKTPGRMIG